MSDPAIRDLAGRLLMIGFEGEVFGDELRDLLLEVRPGGIILFKRNLEGGPDQVCRLISDCQDLARGEFGRPLLVAVDQEGGPVRRLAPPFFQAPSQREMAGTMSAEEVRELAGTGARELAAAGFNMNLAPVLDVVTDSEASYMIERTFSSDPYEVGSYGLSVIQGHDEEGVLTCAKHFPGIGDVKMDPHHDLPTVSHTEGRLKTVESLPFAWAVEHGIAGVMTSHIRYPGLDNEWPATFSERIVGDYLRGELGFKGLVLTDDLEMGAIVKHYRIGPAAVRAVTAGSDLLLICHRPDRILEAREALVEAARSGAIKTDQLEAGAARLEIALAKLPPQPRYALTEVLSRDG